MKEKHTAIYGGRCTPPLIINGTHWDVIDYRHKSSATMLNIVFSVIYALLWHGGKVF